MSKIWSIPYISGVQNHLFQRIRNSTSTLKAYIFERNMIYTIGQVRWQGVFYIVSKRHELWSTNGFKLDRHFYPPYAKSAFNVIARLGRRTPANGTQPNFVNRRTVSRANNLLVHKRAKTGPDSLPAVTIFVPSKSIAHHLSGINVAPHSDSKWNGIGFACSSDSKPQKMLTWKRYRVGGLKWQYIATVATFSSLSFFRRLISELAKRNSTKIGQVIGSECDLKTHVQNLGHPLPLQIGGPKTTFLGRLHNLTTTLTERNTI